MTDESLWINGPDDFAQAPGAGEPHARRQQNSFIGCPVPWLKRVRPAVQSADQLIVALYVYRRTKVCRSKTVSISNAGLQKELGISRQTKYRALSRLESAGIIRIEN